MSPDISIMINGQEYRLDGDILLPSRERGYQEEVLSRLDGIEAEQRVIHDEVVILRTRVDMMLWGGGILFTLLCLIMAYTSLFAPKYWKQEEPAHDKPPQPIIIQVPAYIPQSDNRETA